MRSDTVLDYAVFELSPKHSRCELFVSSNEQTEKLASGLIEPFVNHLKVLESQASPIRLEVEKSNNTWFTKKTLERFVEFVSSPEVLEKVNIYYSEMLQLEAARTLYSQRSEDSKFGASDDGAAADATKKELLRAIDLRLEAIKKDLTMSISHASASGFNPHTVSELQQFADKFGAHQLNEACSKYISLWKKRPDLIEKDGTRPKQNAVNETEHQMQQCAATTSTKKNEEEKVDESLDVTSSAVKTSQHTRRLSVQDRINLFENKQKENSNSGGTKPVALTKSTELRRHSSDLTSYEKPVLRRSNIVSDMSVDLTSEKKLESVPGDPSSTSSSVPHTISLTDFSESFKKCDEVKYELKSDSEKVGDEEASRERVTSSKTVTEKSLVSGVEETSDAQSRSFIDSNDSSASQNQTDSHVGRLQNVTSDAKSRQREEGYELKANNVSQSSAMFPSRHARSRSAHIEASFQGDLGSQPQSRSSFGRIKKKEVVPSEEQPVLSQKPQFNDDGESRQVRANSNRFPTASVDQIQRTRQSKDNPGANDELKMKANELEKLFAEHKLRVPGDQSSSSRRGKPSETQVAQPEPSHHSIGAADQRLSHSIGGSGDLSKLMTPLVGDKDKGGDALRRNFSDVSLTDDSKGKFYEKYMKKRDAKLREEWSLKKGEKETKLKSMQEALEQSRTEMKAKLSASSSERQDSLSSTRQRAEKFRSFNSRSSMKKYQHPINSFQSEEDEDCSEQKPRAKDKAASGQQQLVGNNASRSSQARKPQPNNRNMSSSNTPRTAASVPKPSGKVSNTSSGRRRSDKSVAQSVPNFSELIKENTIPSSLAVKTTMRSQVGSSGRTKNIKEDTSLQRPRSLRKSSSGSIDFTEFSTLCSDDMKASLRVNSDISESLRNEEYDEPEAEAEEVLENDVRDDDEEEEEVEALGFEDENPTLSEVYEKVDHSREDNCSFLPATVPPTFLTAASLMDSPGESPLSWNANLQHSFSYPHEHSSDVDASVDSPMGSPASWSSRMRKKWGTAQSPVTVAAAANNTSQFQSKKDLSKGFKRLLKFGRKSRGAESLMMDWVSVTTSEGDDEVEDRRDFADRSSEDLRKSRMGSLQSHLSEDGFHESEFPEQASNISVSELKDDHQMSGSNFKAQKSFFSLSTFRGKGNDAKPR
ncbi:PREDICTED: uncharacterized protein LOC104712842 [Camelina sativa]|uniref:Uncharacterized protein LOC104712842 n=1 Tax=Camelina sativa TaxID=90675 RepID=A0ABM0TLG7_CAMSA|nr:PREDICTED: uncharacterized protein LOC104712842 [Camelina sativa]